MSTPSKTIGFVFTHGLADWEYGLLSASAVEWFGAKAVALTPEGDRVLSCSGFAMSPDRSAHPEQNADLDAVAVIGSDNWASEHPPDVSALLKSVDARGGIVGGICAGTLTLARAGLLQGVKHTSNGRDWILHHEPNYLGKECYVDTPQAVADRNIVTAPGSAPGTFAHRFLLTLFPEKLDALSEMIGIFAKEHVLTGS